MTLPQFVTVPRIRMGLYFVAVHERVCDGEVPLDDCRIPAPRGQLRCVRTIVSIHRALAACILCLLSTARPALAAPVQWPISTGGNGNFYDVIVTGSMPWSSARDQAESLTIGSLPGRLATINSSVENAFLATEFGDAIRAKWLGGFQPPGSPEPAGNWQWITGEAFAFTNWAPTEPNNSGGRENHLCFATAGGFAPGIWNDLDGVSPPSGFVNGFVVEFVPEPSGWILALGGMIVAIASRYVRSRSVRNLIPNLQLPFAVAILYSFRTGFTPGGTRRG